MAEQKLLKRRRKAQSEGNQNALASVCIDLAELYFREGRYEDSIDQYEIVSNVYHVQNKFMDYAMANRMIGEAYTHMREFNKALKHQEIHLEVAKQQGDKLEEQRALATIGHTYLTSYLDVIDNPNKKPLNLASKAFMKSLNVCESLTGISKREHMDMMTRLFANLGVVQECLGNYEKGIELVTKSINICKANDIYEQLERGYTFLASLHSRKGDYSNAIHHYNLAMEVAQRLDDKVPLMCASLSSKADILIKLSDFQRAKNVLLRAYKLKTPNITERENIENNLKVVTAMCYTEDSLLIAGDSDYQHKKRLYEKMGDGACVLKNFAKAIEYYKKMLDCAEKNGDAGKDLSACYVSLAQTYNDNNEYDLAIEYFKKDYEICRDNVKESIGTLFGLIECMETSGKPLDEVIMMYNRARGDCKKANDTYLEGKVLSRFIATLRKRGSLIGVGELEAELRALHYNPSESSSETDEPTTQNIGDDIDLDNITDNSEASGDETNAVKPRNTRKRNKGLLIKRNNKGETQLHTACIAGNVVLVRKLLEQGHLVNVRDNCGWLPIHEACICGHLEIVQMLVEKGAAVNDRGGSLCNGMTPLHDAASNGHLDIIEYMLGNGASAVAKTDDGDTPLSVLMTWRKSVDLDHAEQRQYENLVDRLTMALDKTGQNQGNFGGDKENRALVVEPSPEKKFDRYDEGIVPRKSRLKTQTVGDLRRNVENDYDDDQADAANEYKNIMSNLRNRTDCTDDIRKRKSQTVVKKPALLESSEFGDDWLEDDMGIHSTKKRKVSNDFTMTSGIRKSTASDQNEPIEIMSDDVSLDTFEFTNHNRQPMRSKRKKQSTLIKAGFIRNRSTSPVSSQKIVGTQQKHKTQKKLTGFTQVTSEADSTSDILMNKIIATGDTPSCTIGKMLSIDVRIEGKLFRIPVPMSEVDTLTMKWLADEATRRFYKKEATRPTIELETKNGAMLAEDDFISVLFPLGGPQSEEVQAIVVKWNIPPLSERYTEACSSLQIDVNQRVLELVETTTVTFNVSNYNLRNDLHPVCRALNRQSNLYELNLSGNCAGDKCVELLCESLPSLDNLRVLNLHSNNLTHVAVSYISTMLQRSNKPLLANLEVLDLSFNPLNNDSIKCVSKITEKLKLKVLNLCSVDFAKNVFQFFYNENVDLHLNFIEELNISYNKLSKSDISMFLSRLNPENLKLLNVGNNIVIEDGLGGEINKLFERNDFGCPNLKSLNLSNCRITDDDVNGLLRVLSLAEKFEELDLSNNAITSNSVRSIIENASLSKLDVSSCENLLQNFDSNSWQFNSNTAKTCRTLLTTLNYVECYTECDKLMEMWKDKYKHLADTRGLTTGMLHLSVSDA